MNHAALSMHTLQSVSTRTTGARRLVARLPNQANAGLRKRPRHRGAFWARLSLLTVLALAITCAVAQAQSLVATVPSGSGPVAAAVNQTTNMVYVADNTVKTLLVINGATNTATTIQASGPFTGVAVNASTNTVYALTSATPASVVVIDGATNAVTTTVTLTAAASVVAVNSVTNQIYVGGADNVSVIDGSTNAIAATISVPQAVSSLAVDTTTNVIWAMYGASGSDSTLAQINGTTNTVVTTVQVGQSDTSLALNAATNKIYVPDAHGNQMYVIDGATVAVTDTIAWPNTILGGQLAVNPATNTIYVNSCGGNVFTGCLVYDVAVLNGATNAVTTGISSPSAGYLLVDSVSNQVVMESSPVVIIDGATNTETVVNDPGDGTGINGTGFALGAVNSATNDFYLPAAGSVFVVSGGAGPSGPAFSASPSPLAFGNQTQGTTSSAKTLTITNTGTSNLAITTVTPGGANMADFILGSDTCSNATVAAGKTCAVSVEFEPSTTSSETATLSFADNASGSPQTVTLTGTGVALAATPTTTTLSASSASVAPGANVTFTATVTPATGAPTPTGTVTFKDGATTLGAGTLNGSGVATYSTSSLALGSHSITASYGGDASNTASTSGVVTVNVALGSTTTSLTASATSIAAGSSLTFTATVTGTSGAPEPTGTVTFKDGATTLGAGTLNGSGVATYSTSSLAVGPHSITASYAGDADNTASTSGVVTVNVALGTTTTSLTASATSIAAGSSLTFTATVTGTSGAPTPTGTVTFKDGATTLGAGTLNASGVATYSTSSLAVGSHSITATYGGDTRNTASTSSAVTVSVVVGSTTTSLTASATSIAAGSSLTFTATVTGTSGAPTPTGTVTFLNGATTLGTGTLNGSGMATYSASALAAGSYSVTAAYAGDANNASSASSAVVVTVWPGPPAFTLTLDPASGSFSAGKDAVITVTVTSVNGFNAATSLACGNLPQNTTCTMSSSTITPAVAGTATSTLTIATDVNANSAALRSESSPTTPARSPVHGPIEIAGALAAFLLLPLLGAKNRKLRRLLLTLSTAILFATLASLGMTGCAGGPTTPNGTYMIQITATAGALSESATYSLTVQ